MTRLGTLAVGLLLAGLAGAQPTAESPSDWLAEGEKLALDRAKVSQDRARELFVRALAAVAGKDRALEARALYRLGLNALFANDPRPAVDYFDRAVALQRLLGLRVEQTRSLNNKAAALWQLGEVASALETYEAVLPLRRELKDRLGESFTEGGIGNCYLTMGEPAAALTHYRAALDVARELGDRNQIAEMQNSLGNALVHVGDFTGARALFEGAEALWKQTNNASRLLYVRNNLGWLNAGLRNYRAALGYLQGIERDLASTGDRLTLAYALHNLGSAYAGLGQLAQAKESFEKSLALKREIGDRSGEAYSLQALGEILPAQAEEFWRQALAIRHDLRDALGLTVTLGALAKLHHGRGDRKLARVEMDQAIGLIESRRAALVSQDLRATYFATKRDYYDFFIDLLLEDDDSDAALQAAERVRGRQLLDRVSDALADVRQGVDPKLLERERQIQRRISLAVGKAPRAQVEALLLQARQAAEEIRRASPRYASLVAPEPLGAAGLQGLLGPGETMLVYHLAEPRSARWTVTHTGVQAARLPGRAAIEARLRRLRQAIVRKEDHAPAARQLAATLIPPTLAGRRLIVAADGVLESAPFSLLWPGEIAFLPSPTALALRRQERPPAGTRVDILADPVFSPQDERVPASDRPVPAGVPPRLRFSRGEAEAIAALAPQRRVAFGADAHRGFLLAARDAGIVHLATHTLLDSQYPELSALVLSQYDAQGRPADGLVRLGEIFNLSLQARLVTLSACRSAHGTDLPGEGLMSLTRGFLYAGAGAVLASLWDVDDRATAELMRRFYRAYLVQKLPLPAALRAAQHSLRAAPGWEHPYYWAGFTLQGEWRP